MENLDLRQSRIPHPRPQTTSALGTISESQNNSCNFASSIRHPAPTGLKRPGSDIRLQPERKRQTLAERAGQYHGTLLTRPPVATPDVASSVKGTSIASLVSKTASLAKQTSTQPQAPVSSSQPYTGAADRFTKSAGQGSSHHTRKPVSARHASKGWSQQSLGKTQLATSSDARIEQADLASSKKHNVLDVDERLREVESQFCNFKDVMNQTLTERNSLEEVVELTKTRANDLQQQKEALEDKNASLQSEVHSLKLQVQAAVAAVETERREKTYKLEGQARDHEHAIDRLRRKLTDEVDQLRQGHGIDMEALKRQLKKAHDEEMDRGAKEIADLKARLNSEQQHVLATLEEKDNQLLQSNAIREQLQNDLEHERHLKDALQSRLDDAAASSLVLEERIRMLTAQVDFLKSDSKQQSDQFSEMEARMQEALRLAEEAQRKLMKEETERRALFNKYQELKGNIRVMCRVRPSDGSVSEDDSEAKISFPDVETSCAQVEVTGPEEKNSLGIANRKVIPFEFDRVFSPSVSNDEIFGEISQLVQSALDGYNVCIFCYGQTGSGKTYTMSSPDGMIPRATHMIYDSIKRLEEKSWAYSMEGSFVEVYNEELHDLLGGPLGGSSGRDAEPKKKLEIRHDESRKTTTVVNCEAVHLDSVDKVESILRTAQSNRSVAATKANERSSRSHSVFMIKLVGENTSTGERCEGTLNLVDLAGSERLKQSGAVGDRKRETQNINKSLACLGDVIEALGRGASHVPYRNSKLTHLLQYSLGGNSKTLMFVMVSPLAVHLKETLTSLRFATKVHNTHIGQARSSKKAHG